MIGLAFVLIYFYIGVVCVARRAADIACWEAFNPSSDTVVFWRYCLTWPLWVLRK